MIAITRKEYDAIIYAYARLEYIVRNNQDPEYIQFTKPGDEGCVRVFDHLIDRINEWIESQEQREQEEEDDE